MAGRLATTGSLAVTESRSYGFAQWALSPSVALFPVSDKEPPLMPDQITNPMADPLVELPDVSPTSQLVDIDATPEGAVTVTMCRAAKKHAFDAGLISALDEAFKDLQGAEGVRVIFLRGAGGAFSAGADLDWMRQAVDASEAANREDAMALAVMLKRLWDLPAL